MTLKHLNAGLLAVGLLCLVVMLNAVGVGSVWRGLASLGWGLLPLILLEGVGSAFDTQAWRCCVSSPVRSMPWARFYWIRMAGYAVSYFTPTATFGGEVARVSLIASSGDAAEAASAVLIDKVTLALAHLILIAVGGSLLFWRLTLPASLEVAMLVSAGLLAAGIGVFLLIQKHGRFGTLLRWLVARKIGGSRVQKLSESACVMDQALQTFYSVRRRDFALALFWHEAAFAMGFLQTWWFLTLVNQHPSVTQAATVWIIGLWFDLLVFAVPMNLGTLEGASIVAFAAVGFGAVDGMTYGMALRLGQLFWTVQGLAGYAVLTFRLPGLATVTTGRRP